MRHTGYLVHCCLQEAMMGASNSSKYGNFILQTNTKLLNFPIETKKAIEVVCETFDLAETEIDAIYLSAEDIKSEYSDSILPYIRKIKYIFSFYILLKSVLK